MANCVVLGADGFIGSHLTEALVQAGHSVRAFDRFKNKLPHNLPVGLKNVEVIGGDFLNRHDVEEAIAGCEYVFQLVSTTTPISSGLDPFIDIDTNIRMSVEVLELCRKHNVKRVIFPSTGGAIYGRDQAKAFRETDLAQPMSPYAIGKLAIEGFMRYYQHAHGLDYLALRISNPYGERQNIIGNQGVIPIFLNLIKHDQPLTVYGDGSNIRDYLYIKDLVDMIVAMFDQPTEHNLYNIGSGQPVSLSELITILGRITDKTVQVEHKPARPTDVQRVYLDVERYQAEFPSAQPTKLDEGLTKTWEYVRSLEP